MTVKDLLEKNINREEELNCIFIYKNDSYNNHFVNAFVKYELYEFDNDFKTIKEWVIYCYGKYWVKNFKIEITGLKKDKINFNIYI